MEYIGTFVTAIIVILVFYLAQIPARRQDKELKKMQDELKIKDRIITYSGLCGEIEEVLEDRVILKTEPDKIRISVEKWAVAGIDERTLEKKEEKENKKESKKEKEEHK